MHRSMLSGLQLLYLTPFFLQGLNGVPEFKTTEELIHSRVRAVESPNKLSVVRARRLAYDVEFTFGRRPREERVQVRKLAWAKESKSAGGRRVVRP